MENVESRMSNVFARHWWILLVRGIAAIIFGILALLLPQITLTTLVLLFGAYALVDGVFDVWNAISGRKEDRQWWLLLLEGLVGIVVGVLTFLAPGITGLVLLYYIAIWAIITGVLEVVQAIRIRKEIEGEWRLIVGGLASVLFGVILIMAPGAGALGLIWIIGVYAIVFGLLLILLAFRVRGIKGQTTNS